MSMMDVEDFDVVADLDIGHAQLGDVSLSQILPFSSHLVRQKAIAYIDKHLLSPDLRPSSVAAGVHVSRAVLYRAFHFDGGVASFLHERRLEKARSMLEARAGEPGIVQKVASAHGYASAVRFSRLFASHFSEQPAQFVRRIRAASLASEAPGRNTTGGPRTGGRAAPDTRQAMRRSAQSSVREGDVP